MFKFYVSEKRSVEQMSKLYVSEKLSVEQVSKLYHHGERMWLFHTLVSEYGIPTSRQSPASAFTSTLRIRYSQ